MRVVFVVNSLGTGGAERSLVEMLPHFRRAGVQATVVCFYRRAEGVERDAIAAGFDVRFLRGKSMATRVVELAGIVRSVRADLVHSALMEANLVARGARLLTRTPLVCSLVNMPYEPARHVEDQNVGAVRLGAVRLIDTVSAAAAVDHFHAITDAVKQSAMRRLRIPSRKISVVYRGRDPERLGTKSASRRSAVRAALGVGESELVVLNAARREFQKGQCYLLDAFAQVRRSVPDAQLWIAGREGNASASLASQVERLGLTEPAVRFLGHRSDVPDLLAACDVFCLPSLWEGLGGVLLEALGLGVPIVASRLPPVEEVLSEGSDSLLVEPADPHQLAAALTSLLKAPAERRRLSEAGQARFQSQFRQDVIARQMLDLFMNVRTA